MAFVERSAKKAKRAGAQERKRTPLTPESITEAAVRLADDEGLEAVSIRRVAGDLNARPMSIYNHFASKQDLLASMLDVGIGEMLVDGPLPDDWREALAISSRKMYAAYARHPWMLFIVIERPGPGPNGIRLAKQMARTLDGLPVDPNQVWQINGIANDYVIGYAFRTVATVDADEMKDAIATSDIVEFPELAALPDELRSRASIDRFELGLQTVLDGISLRFLS